MEGGKKGYIVLWIFMGIILFITILYPIFGINLKYQIGTAISTTLIKLGSILIMVGTIILILGFIMLFISGTGSGALKPMLIGFFLIVLGVILIDPMGTSYFTQGREAPKGYH